jgi:hypothetical protein
MRMGMGMGWPVIGYAVIYPAVVRRLSQTQSAMTSSNDARRTSSARLG